MTLLEKAKKHPTRRIRTNDITEEYIELAVAWARGQVNYTQAAVGFGYDIANGKHTMSVYVNLARSLRQAVQNGILKPSSR